MGLLMRLHSTRLLSLLLVAFSWLGSGSGQRAMTAIGKSAPVTVEAETMRGVDGAVAADNKMQCDGTNDDTVALQRAIDAARGSANPLTLPSGTCLVTATITIPDNIWIQGAGKLATTIRRKSGVNLTTNMFDLSGASGNVTITDLTIDANKEGNPSAGQYSLGAAGVQAIGVHKLTIERTKWVNAYLAAIGLFVNPGQFIADTLIADSDFENNGRSTTFTSDQLCNAGDIAIRSPLRIKVVRNRSENASGNFVCFGTNLNSGVGDVVVSDNTVHNAAGFGIALGGTAGRGAVLSHNVLEQPSSRESNIDLALWYDVTVADNHIVAGSVCPQTGCAGIGDAPPAQHVTVSGNTIVGAPSLPGGLCIGLGGSDLTITKNTCRNAGGAGIGIAVPDKVQSHNIVISGNDVKNGSQAQAGIHAGIQLYIACGPNPKCSGGTGAISDVTIEGNTVYDDQEKKTQGYGVGVAVHGQSFGFTNLRILNNDLKRNRVGPILSRARGATGWEIRGNF